MAMTLEELAGLGEDPSDVMSDSNPYVRLAEARRLRTSRLTPGGLPQPPEVMGVDGDPRTQNDLQPMPGEFGGGSEINQGNPGFHNPSMPPSNGLANQSMTMPGQMQGTYTPAGRRLTGVVRRGPAPPPTVPVTMPHPAGVPFGAPTGTTSLEALAGLPPLQDDAYPLAALPHFAGGGVLPPGGTGVVGDATGNPADEEVVRALPGGGAEVIPSPHINDGMGASRARFASIADPHAAPLASVSPSAATGMPRYIPSGAAAAPVAPKPETTYPNQIAGLPDDTPTREELLAGLGPVNYGRPPQETSAADRYQKALGEFEPGGDLSADKAPRPEQYKAHGWRRVLGDIAGVAAGALSFSPGAGMLVHDAITGEPYRQASDDYERQRRLALAALPELQGSAQLESQQNADRQTQYNADRTAEERQWKDQQDIQNEQARIQAERDKTTAMYPPLPVGDQAAIDTKTPEGRQQFADQHPERFQGFTRLEREAWVLDGRLPARAAEPQAAGTNTPTTPKGQLTDAQRALTETRLRTTAQHDLARLDQEKNRDYANQEKAFQARINDWLKRNRDATQDEIRQMRQQMDTWNNEQKGNIQSTYEQSRQRVFDTLAQNLDQLGGDGAPPPPAAPTPALTNPHPSQAASGGLDPQIAAKIPVGKFAHFDDGSVWTKNPDGTVVEVRSGKRVR